MTPSPKPDTPQERKELREKLAEIEHIRWSDWQKWMHSKMVEHSDGKGEWVCLPAELFRRWERQIATNYADLPAHEQASDMEQVDRYWPLIEQALQQARSDAIGQVDRFEVIDETGRAYVKGSIYGSPVSVELSYQDEGRTLKVFVSKREQLKPAGQEER